jgi:hypothetical protein
MDPMLRQAIARLLDTLDADQLVTDLLIIEVDWGKDAPAVQDDAEEVQFQGVRWPLIYTNSELILRRTLCQSTAGRAILAVPGGNGFVLPRDVQARAHPGRVMRLGLQHRLGAQTERNWPAEVDKPEWRPSVQRHLAALVEKSRSVGLTNWTITRDDLERFLVSAAFGLEVAGRSAAQLLAALLAHQRRQPTPPTPLERTLLQGQLRSERVEGQEILAWAAEETGRAEALVQTGLMLDAERAAQRMPNWGGLNSLRAVLVNQRQLSEQEAVSAVIDLATGALEPLHHETAKSIARAAERELLAVLPETAYNRWFPRVLEREIKRIGQRLAVGAPEAAAAVERLTSHFFASAMPYKVQIEALELMATLVAGRQEQSPTVEALADVTQWCLWYGQHGSRLDLAALRLKHLQEQGNELGDSMATLLASYWAWRDQLNARFAQRLLAGYESALHDRSGGVFGVHRVLEWIVRPLRSQARRVLLVIVDGMSYADFWCLVEQLRGASLFVQEQRPLLSLLPSVTAMARKALFLNALPTDRLDDDDAYEQKARASETRTLEAAFPQDTVRLYNKSNIGDGQGLRSSLEFPGTDLVAVILNAIDDDLRSTTTSVRLPRLDDLGPLLSVADSALKHGWAVVVTADHGHTWFRDKERRIGPVKPGGGERYMPLAAGEAAPAGAVVTSDPHIVRVQDGQKAALLTPVGAYFGQQPRRGFHGGASLEEMIVPCAWLTDKPPSGPEQGPTAQAPASEASPESYDVQGVILRFADGRTVDLTLPFSLAPKEAQLLQALARLGEASEQELRQAVNTRRVAGLIAGLMERLAAAGPAYDLIVQEGAGPQGAIYRFRTELLTTNVGGARDR